MAWLYLCSTILCFAILGLVCKLGSQRGASSLGLVTMLYSTSTLASLAWFLAEGRSITLDAVLLGGGCGLTGCMGFLLFVKSMEIGHYAFSGSIFNSAFLVSTLYAGLFSVAGLSRPQVVGVLLLLGAIFLITFSGSSSPQAAQQRKSWGKWALLIFMAFLFNGIALIFVGEGRGRGVPISVFLFMLYLSGMVMMIALTVRGRSARRSTIIFGLLAAAASFIGNVLSLVCVTLMSYSTVFPITLSGTVLMAVMLSLVVLKERINNIGYVGIACEIVGIVIVYNEKILQQAMQHVRAWIG